MPRSVSLVGLAQSGVIPQNNSTSECSFYDLVVLGFSGRAATVELRLVSSGGCGGRVLIWGTGVEIGSVAFSPDGQTPTPASEDATAKLYK